jgi:ABC-type glycerol-3-phosphate transport system substrate-binding protein
MASKEADRLWSMEAGIMPIRQSTIEENSDFFANPANAYLVDAATISRESGWLPPEGAGTAFDEGLNSAMSDVMTNGTDPKAALEKAEAAFNRTNRL